MGYSVVLVTTSSPEEARRIARVLLEKRLVACVNLIPQVDSSFWWEGKLEEAQEALMVLKTREEALPRLVEEIKGLHSYTVCEVVALPIVHGNRAYLDWIRETVQL